MIKIVIINTFDNGSTGKICLGLKKTAESNGMYASFFCERWKHSNSNDVNYLGTRIGNFISAQMGKLGFKSTIFSRINTNKLIKRIKDINPDVIHIHNLHNNYIDLKLFFNFLKKSNYKVIWTLHDCWSFTGRCPYFTLLNCYKWKTGCFDCKYSKKLYPQSFFDRSKTMWIHKKECFLGLQDLVIVTPSRWLEKLVKESFLKNYPIVTINNGIDLQIFKQTLNNSFRKKHRIGRTKYLLLGVAFDWGHRKGLDVFIELAKKLNNDYQIVLVGTNEKVDKSLPNTIISIHRTSNQKELAEIYSSADLFINPTREENYPTVNMEAIACGTPVVTFSTGGSPEIIDDKTGRVVRCGDIDEMKRQIIDICEHHSIQRIDCLEKAKTFDLKKRFKKYLDLYNSQTKENIF